MTRKEIETQVTLNLNDARTNTVTQIHNSLDIVLRQLVYKLNISTLAYNSFIRTTSGRMQYPLASEVRQVQGQFYIPEDNVDLDLVSLDDFNESNPDPDDTDIPYVAMMAEVFPCKQQPHSKVRLVSDDAADTMAVTIHGQSYGRYRSEAVTMTGLTAVLSTVEFQKVYRLVAASAATGTITATSNSSDANTALPTVATAGDVTVGTITAGNTESSNVISPGAKIRIEMDADVAGDQSQSVRIEGLGIDTTNGIDEVELAETLTTDGSDATDSVISTNRYTELRRITKGWDSTNTLLVMTDPGDIVIAEISERRRAVEYPQVRFYNVPEGKTVHYRYTPGYTKLANDNDDISDVVPEVYHQVVAEFTEKLVRGLHGDAKLGIRGLEGNPEFMEAVRNVRKTSHPANSERIVLGSDWQQSTRRFMDFPITHSTN